MRGQGTRLYDANGEAYLDAYNNVVSVGHCHPHVVEAVQAQAATLITHTRYLHEGILTYAENLLATLPEEIDRVMFLCSGSEANDLAVRIAQAATASNSQVSWQIPSSPPTASFPETPPVQQPYFNTFAGNPLSMAAAQATLEVL